MYRLMVADYDSPSYFVASAAVKADPSLGKKVGDELFRETRPTRFPSSSAEMPLCMTSQSPPKLLRG